jgi:hypothetical protein
MFPAAPDRPDRVNDEPGRQTISASNFRLPGLTTAQRSTFGEQFRSGSAMNRAVHSAPAEKRRVCCVHNGIDFESRNVAAEDVDLSRRAQNSATEVQGAGGGKVRFISSAAVLFRTTTPSKFHCPRIDFAAASESIQPSGNGTSRSSREK